MPKSLCRTHYCAGLVACLLLAGCKPATAVVTGKVRFQRQPLTSGSVLIFSQDKQIISGLILPDGTYRIANVPFGVARVTVRTHPLVPPGFNHPQRLPPSKNAPVATSANGDARYVAIPERFNLPEESGLVVNVGREDQEFDINLTP
jgi:hypothetical protein